MATPLFKISLKKIIEIKKFIYSGMPKKILPIETIINISLVQENDR